MAQNISFGYNVIAREPIDSRIVFNGRPWRNSRVVADATTTADGTSGNHLAYDGLISVDTSDDTVWFVSDLSNIATQAGWTQITGGSGGADPDAIYLTATAATAAISVTTSTVGTFTNQTSNSITVSSVAGLVVGDSATVGLQTTGGGTLNLRIFISSINVGGNSITFIHYQNNAGTLTLPIGSTLAFSSVNTTAVAGNTDVNGELLVDGDIFAREDIVNGGDLHVGQAAFVQDGVTVNALAGTGTRALGVTSVGALTTTGVPSGGGGSTHITDVDAATVTSTPAADATISPVNGSYTLLDSQHASTAAAIPLGSIFRMVTSAAGVTPLAFQVFRVVERLTNGLVALPNTVGADHGDARILTTEDLEFVSRDHILTDSDIEVTGSAHFENLITVGGNAFIEDDVDVNNIHLRGGINFPDGTTQTTAPVSGGGGSGDDPDALYLTASGVSAGTAVAQGAVSLVAGTIATVVLDSVSARVPEVADFLFSSGDTNRILGIIRSLTDNAGVYTLMVFPFVDQNIADNSSVTLAKLNTTLVDSDLHVTGNTIIDDELYITGVTTMPSVRTGTPDITDPVLMLDANNNVIRRTITETSLVHHGALAETPFYDPEVRVTRGVSNVLSLEFGDEFGARDFLNRIDASRNNTSTQVVAGQTVTGDANSHLQIGRFYSQSGDGEVFTVFNSPTDGFPGVQFQGAVNDGIPSGVPDVRVTNSTTLGDIISGGILITTDDSFLTAETSTTDNSLDLGVSNVVLHDLVKTIGDTPTRLATPITTGGVSVQYSLNGITYFIDYNSDRSTERLLAANRTTVLNTRTLTTANI